MCMCVSCRAVIAASLSDLCVSVSHPTRWRADGGGGAGGGVGGGGGCGGAGGGVNDEGKRGAGRGYSSPSTLNHY